MLFDECCEYNSNLIANGSLILGEEYLQVDESTHSTLSQINKNGFITYSSQDGIDLEYQTYDERPYIQGFIKKNKIENINCLIDNNQNFKLIIHTIPPISDEYEGVTKYKPYSLRVHEAFNGKIPFGETFTRIFYGYEQIAIDLYLKKLNLINEDDIIYITIIDFRWNYNAMNNDGLFTSVLKCLH